MRNASQDTRDANKRAWNAQRYAAWVAAYGHPEDAAKRILTDPEHVLRRLLPYLGDVHGQYICNVQGSHGRVAVALASLGAKVEVIDFAEENRRYALDLADAAGVTIDYTVCDILDAPARAHAHRFDTVLLELGILHYHQDLDAFFGVMRKLSTEGGRLLLNEFHPVQRKLFWPDGPHDYFDDALVSADVPRPHNAEALPEQCHYRFWTISEIVNAAITAGFILTHLDEHPDPSDPSIPGFFTLLAQT